MNKLCNLPGINSVLAQAIADATQAQNPMMELESFIDLSLKNGTDIGFCAPSSPAELGPSAKWSAAHPC